jgi:hypothetical protein
MNRVLRDALVTAALAASWPIAAQAQLVVGRQVTVIQTVATSEYLNGGVGLDEQAAMRRLSRCGSCFPRTRIGSSWPTFRW